MDSVWEDIFKNGAGPGSVKFICSDGVIYAPKVIIVRRSEYLSTMLDGYFVETVNQEVNLPNYDIINVKVVLSYLCRGKLPDLGIIGSSFKTMDLARCWLVNEIIEYYEKFYCYSSVIETKINAIICAKKYNFDKLEKNLVESIGKHIIYNTYKHGCIAYFEKITTKLGPEQKEQIKQFIINNEEKLRVPIPSNGFHYDE